MAYTGIFATEAELNSKAGENVDATGWTEANKNQWIAEAEAEINCVCRKNFSDLYGTLNSDVKKILTGVASDLVEIKGIVYNMSGYTSRVEAEDMINVHRDSALRGLAILRDKKTQDFMTGD